jgi:hypothetical protein
VVCARRRLGCAPVDAWGVRPSTPDGARPSTPGGARPSTPGGARSSTPRGACSSMPRLRAETHCRSCEVTVRRGDHDGLAPVHAPRAVASRSAAPRAQSATAVDEPGDGRATPRVESGTVAASERAPALGEKVASHPADGHSRIDITAGRSVSPLRTRQVGCLERATTPASTFHPTAGTQTRL